MWLRIKRVLVFLFGIGCTGIAIAFTVRQKPEMPSAGFTVGLWIAIFVLLGFGAWLVWLSLRGTDDDIKEIT